MDIGRTICNALISSGKQNKANIIFQILEEHRSEIERELGERSYPELGTIACPKCDKPRMEHLTNIHSIRSNSLICRQLSHGDIEGTGNKKYKQGIVTLNRLLRPISILTPKAEMRAKAKCRTLLADLKRKPHIATEVNYKLEKDYLNKKTLTLKEFLTEFKMTEEEFNKEVKFTSTLLVTNYKSESTPIRLCLNPAMKNAAEEPDILKAEQKGYDTKIMLAQYQDPKNQITMNDTIHKYTLSLPDMVEAAVSQTVASITLSLDLITDATI